MRYFWFYFSIFLTFVSLVSTAYMVYMAALEPYNYVPYALSLVAFMNIYLWLSTAMSFSDKNKPYWAR